MKTLRGHLRTLPEPYRGECFRRCYGLQNKHKYSTFEDAIDYAIARYGVSEFWTSLKLKVLNGELSNKPEPRPDLAMPRMPDLRIPIRSQQSYSGCGRISTDYHQTDDMDFEEQYAE